MRAGCGSVELGGDGWLGLAGGQRGFVAWWGPGNRGCGDLLGI